MGSFDNAERVPAGNAAMGGDPFSGARAEAFGKPLMLADATEPTGTGNGSGNINNTSRSDASAASNATANGGNTSIRSITTVVTAPSFGGGECSKAKSGGIGYMGIGASYGQSDLDEDCEKRRVFQSVCGDANQKASIAIQALAVSASMPETRTERYQATDIARGQANLAMDANENCFNLMGIQHRPQEAPAAAENPGYVTKQEFDQAQKDNDTKLNQAFKHSMYK